MIHSPSPLPQDIQDLVATHALRVGDAPFNRCYEISVALAQDLRRASYPARLIQVAGLIPLALAADKRWRTIPQTSWTHYVVGLEDLVIDLTRRQFFPASRQPYIRHFDAFCREWTGCFEITLPKQS